MGFTPAQVDEMSMWEFQSCLEGYRAAHQPEGGSNGPSEMPSDEDLRAMGIKGF